MKKKGFKAFKKGYKCRGFQYEIGKTYELEGKVEVCGNGFHYCENPMDVLEYYDLCDSVFARIEDDGNTKVDGDKSATDKITITEELSLSDFTKCCVEYMIENADFDSDNAASGYYSKLAASGDRSNLAASGYCSKLAASGNCSKLAASGDRSNLAASGDCSKLAASGDRSNLAASGDYSNLAASGGVSNLAASGDYSNLAASGRYSKLAASGDRSNLAASGGGSNLAASGDRSNLAASGNESKLSASGGVSNLAASGPYSKLAASGGGSTLSVTGSNSVIAGIGANSKAKGVVGTWIGLVEYNDYGKCIGGVFQQVDGVNIKENTWYIVKGCKLVEA